MSPPRPSLLSEVLVGADAVYGAIIEAHAVAVAGRKADALGMLSALRSQVEAHRPLLQGVLKVVVEDQSRHGLSASLVSDPSNRPPLAANDDEQSASPEHPGPSVA